MTKTNIDLTRVAIILLFAISFAVIGTFAPVLYATYVPQDSIIEAHSFEAQDTTTESTEHYVCFDRTVKQPSTGEVFSELYLIDEDDNRVKVESQAIQRYFQKGRTEVITPFSLPDELREGTYRYLLVVNMDLADGRVTRDFAFKSEEFTITDGREKNVERPISC